MVRDRFFVLFGALWLLLFATPVVHDFGLGWSPLFSRTVLSVVFVAMLLSAGFAVSRTRRQAIFAATLSVPLLVCETAALLAPESTPIETASDVLGILFLAYVASLILRFLFTTDRVTANTICGALCVYLLLGVLWTLAYSVTYRFDEDAFRTSAGDSAALQFGGERSVDAMYFSFVTLTTLGYGDIAPNSPTGKMISVTEAIVGQLFLAVLVARLVGMHITHAASSPSSVEEK